MRNKINEEGGKNTMSLTEIINGLFNILDQVKNFLYNFGDIAQKFFDMLP